MIKWRKKRKKEQKRRRRRERREEEKEEALCARFPCRCPTKRGLTHLEICIYALCCVSMNLCYCISSVELHFVSLYYRFWLLKLKWFLQRLFTVCYLFHTFISFMFFLSLCFFHVYYYYFFADTKKRVEFVSLVERTTF